jgi:Flp pilus assembly protein TadG
MRFRGRRCGGDGGWAVAEMVILMPLTLAVLGFIILCGRMGNINADVTSVSRDAARAASLQPTLDAAGHAAQDTTVAALAARSVTCHQPTARIDAPTTFVAGGFVTVTVTCQVDLAGIAIPSIPATGSVSKSSTEPIDRFRA